LKLSLRGPESFPQC